MNTQNMKGTRGCIQGIVCRAFPPYAKRYPEMNQATKKESLSLNDVPADLPGDTFEYAGPLLCWTLLEGHWYTTAEIREIFLRRQLRPGTQTFLVVATENAALSIDCIECILSMAQPSGKAIAFVTGSNLATSLLVGFYIKTYKPSLATKLFKTQDQAKNWLAEQLSS